MSGTVRETAIRHSSPDRHTIDNPQPGTSAPRDTRPRGIGQRDAAPGETAPLNNPYAAPRFADRPAEDTTRTLRSLMWLYTVVVIAATVCCFVQIRSIVVSGVVLSITGLLLVRTARRHANAPGVLLGLTGPVISVGSLIVINVWDWSPDEAVVPMRTLGVIYSVVSLFLLSQSHRVIRQQAPFVDTPESP